MPHVVFIAPRFMPNTNRYVKAFTDLPDVKLSVVSQDPEEAIPAALRSRVAGHYRVDHSFDGDQLTTAVRAIARGVGKVDRLAGALEELQLPMAQVRDELGIEGIGGEVARNFRDKDRMKDVLRAAGVPVAKSGLAHSPEAVRKFVDEVGFPIIIKPQAGLGARSTYRVESAAELEALERKGVVPRSDAPLQIEEFIRARERTCETVTVKGVPVWRSGTIYLPSPLHVLETPWIQYCVLLPREEVGADDEMKRFADVNGKALAALFGKSASTAAGTALSHMEWFLRDDGTSLVNEVGVRPPGVQIMPLMSIAHEMDFWAKWAELIALDRFEARPRKWAAGAAFFRGQGAGDRVVSVTGVEAAVEALGDALVEMRTPKVGMARAKGYEGEGWATVRAETTEGAKKALKTVIETVQVRYG
jgi:phosphoribosylaminoimidazole carboxylase (NCAIR synthetase)